MTRQFDFGQFVLLYHDDPANPSEPVVPLVVYPDGHLSVVQDPPPTAPAVPAGGVAVPITSDAITSGVSATSSAPQNLLGAAGGLPLQLALTADSPLQALSAAAEGVDVDDLAPLLSSAPSIPGHDGVPELDDGARAALLSGRSVTVLTRDPADAARVGAVTIRPAAQEVTLAADQIDAALATGLVALPDGRQLALPASNDAWTKLRTGGSMHAAVPTDDAVHLFRFTADLLASSAPLGQTFLLDDPSALLLRPFVPAIDGSPLPVPFTPQNVADLRTQGTTQVTVNGSNVRISVGSDAGGTGSAVFDPSRPGFLESAVSQSSVAQSQEAVSNLAVPLSADPDAAASNLSAAVTLSSAPGADGPAAFYGSSAPGSAALTIQWPQGTPAGEVRLGTGFAQWLQAVSPEPVPSQPAVPAQTDAVSSTPGLQVAVFLPWRQTWTFLGLSRGSLLSSIALAPQEERRMRTFSWERKTRTLEQSSETDTSLEQDFTSTTRDTEDVFNEMTASQHFTSQLHADVNASYSTGVASINASAGGSLANETGLQQVARTTTQHMTETVHRASAQVRSQRITRVTEAQDSISSTKVVSVIRNANEARTLTFNYFEQLAHYRIDTSFRRDQVRVVAMIPNPLGSTQFSNLTVRTNESVLQEALLNSELSDAFAAARLLASYDFAWIEAQRIAEAAKAQAELDRERTVPPDPATDAQHPPNPYTDVVLAAASDVRAAAQPIVAAQIDPALYEIGKHETVPATDAASARQWLWVMLAQAKAGGGTISVLQKLASTSATLTLDDARRVLDAFSASVLSQLGTLAQLPDTEKEQNALGAAIHRHMKAAWDWGWWTDQCRSNGLYAPDDNGITGAVQRLSDAMGQYTAKASEGDAVLAQQDMVNQGNEEQDSQTWVDKLDMKYGLDVVADAREREQALLAHLSSHADYYRFVLFQALPPGEQLSLLTQLAPQLQIGFFEPRVVAYSGSSLAVPLTPTGQNELASFVHNLSEVLGAAADEAQEAADAMYPDDVILPTPGLVIETSLGNCVATEPERRDLRRAELDLAEAHVANVQAEAARRQARLRADPPLLDPFWIEPTSPGTWEFVRNPDTGALGPASGDHDGS